MFKKIKSRMNSRNWLANYKKKLSIANQEIKRLTVCKECYTFYYKNAWHFDKPEYLRQNNEEEVRVRFIECPACVDKELAMYEMESDLVLGKGQITDVSPKYSY